MNNDTHNNININNINTTRRSSITRITRKATTSRNNSDNDKVVNIIRAIAMKEMMITTTVMSYNFDERS